MFLLKTLANNFMVLGVDEAAFDIGVPFLDKLIWAYPNLI